MIKHLRCNQEGFILLEIMVCVSIIAIVFVSLFRMQSGTINLAAIGKFNSIAPFLAQMQLAKMESDLTNWSESSGQFEKNSMGYEWQCSITQDELENLIKIDLTITHNDKGRVYKVTTWRYSDTDE